MALADDIFSAEFWRRYMLETFLTHWKARCLDADNGGYIADFDRMWRPAGPQNKSLVSQGRLVYTFSAGLRHTGSPEYAEAAARGAEFLNLQMADRQQGGWFWRVGQDGSILEPAKHTYGHAFVIFGLSEYARACGATEAGHLALETLMTLRDRAAGPGGGSWTLMDRQWQPVDRLRSQNPHMHLLEACLSLYGATGSSLALDTAVQIAELAADRFVHPRFGCLEERFAEDWSSPADGDAEPVRIGHQFEWCWLLNRLADRTGQQRWRDLGGQLLEWGLYFGSDLRHGGFHNACDRRGHVVDTSKSHWAESEALRTLLYLVVERRREDLRRPLTHVAEFALDHLADREYGGWYTSVTAAGAAEDERKGSEWKLDYHMVSLCDEAVRVLSEASAATGRHLKRQRIASSISAWAACGLAAERSLAWAMSSSCRTGIRF